MTACQRGSLAAAALGLVLVLLDASAVNIAFDQLLQQFDTDIAGLQWVVNSYTLSLAALLLAGGALGDRFGARKVFVCGLSVFTAASLGCAAAHSFAALIIARMGQGVGAALMVPTSLSMLQLAFPVLEQRSRAVGWWAAIGGASMAVGPVIGGLLVGYAGWRSIFLINLPVALLALYLTYRYVLVTEKNTFVGVDWPGQLAATLTVACLIVVLTEIGSLGLAHTFVLLAIASTGICGAGFIWIQSRSKAPMLPLYLLRTSALAVTSVAGAIVNFGYYGLIFVFSLFFQLQLKFSPQQTGFAFLPMTLILVFVNVLAGRLLARWGARVLMSSGFLVAATGYLLLLKMSSEGAYSDLVIPMLIAASGMALIVPTMTNAMLSSVPPSHGGIASGVLNTARQVGGVMGVAVFGYLISDTQSDAFMQGMRLSINLCVWVLLGGAVLCWAGLSKAR